MTPDDLTEKVARAMCASDFDGDTNVYDMKNNNFRADYLFRARAALRVALEEAAVVVEQYRNPTVQSNDGGYAEMLMLFARHEVAAVIRAMIPTHTDV